MTVAVIAGALGIIVLTIAIGVVIDRKLGVDPDKLRGTVRVPASRAPAHGGDTAATAIRARGEQLAKLRASQKCPTCREPLAAAGDDERVRYGDGELLVVHLACAAGHGSRTLYVDDR